MLTGKQTQMRRKVMCLPNASSYPSHHVQQLHKVTQPTWTHAAQQTVSPRNKSKSSSKESNPTRSLAQTVFPTSYSPSALISCLTDSSISIQSLRKQVYLWRTLLLENVT